MFHDQLTFEVMVQRTCWPWRICPKAVHLIEKIPVTFLGHRSQALADAGAR
jgi:hypothetical protein